MVNSANAMRAMRGGAMSRRATENEVDTASKLPAELIQARRFGKARSAKSTALLEDYVELIADLLASTGEARPTDIARRLGVSHVTAVKTISRLKR
jgi:DtxR family manganese transport transcriptional regulator